MKKTSKPVQQRHSKGKVKKTNENNTDLNQVRESNNNDNRITDFDIYHFKEGSHFRLYDKLGGHITSLNGELGTYFAVWAPNAKFVSIISDQNGWSRRANPLNVRWDDSGIWEGFIPGMKKGDKYKFHIESMLNGYKIDKADPFAFYNEVAPKTASIIWDLEHQWDDSRWMKDRKKRNSLDSPISIYEVHLGSWRRVPGEGHRYLNYRELALELAEYLKELEFTHVEFLPIMEHPFYGSWGYQVTGYFAPTSRFGTPQDFMFLINHLHKNEIGVILDWVPSHFTTDDFGLGFFDGTHLFEHDDTRKGIHPDWKSYIFNYGRNEVRNFLISSALFWLDKYHIDGIRVDAVASMLYLDYSRNHSDWIPNRYGGRENIEAIEFLRRFNEEVYNNYPDVQTIAEESTAWPMVSKPTYLGGLGFGMKWDMGWMHDTLLYMSKEPVHRKYHHDNLTFRLLYAFHENFILPLSHDEVVHGKGSLIGKMPNDDWQKFANLRLLFGYMYGQPGKKLLFMGCEFGQLREWQHDESLDWHLMEFEPHKGVQRWVADLNKLYRHEPLLHTSDFHSKRFEWVDCSDSMQSVFSFIRKNESVTDNGIIKEEYILVIGNFTPVPRYEYLVGVPKGGYWREVLNSDSTIYGGSGLGNLGGVNATSDTFHGRPFSISITLPPLGILFFRSEDEK